MNFVSKTAKAAIISVLIVSISVLANFQAISADSGARFTDVKATSWYSAYVEKLVKLKITSGTGNNKFGPDKNVTRAEFVTFVCKATGLEKLKGYDLEDTSGHWAAEWITAAVTAGIIDRGTSFEPNKAVTRQQAVEMLCRALKLQADTAMQTPYADVDTEPGYSSTAYKEYLMLGTLSDNKRYFKPDSNITRAETAAVIVNVYDYKTNPDKFRAGKLAEAQEEKAAREEAVRFAAWKDSVKNVPATLLSNTKGLYRPSVYESHKYLQSTDYLKNWGAKYKMTPEEFEKELVRVGTKYGNVWANADYRKLAELEANLRSLWEKNVINNYLKRNLDYVKNNTLVSEGDFTTSTGMLVFADFGNPVLRGTMKCKYLNSTSTKVLNADCVEATGKHLELGVWYEQDFEIHFLPEDEGLKVTSMNSISGIRISK
ncbi:endoglucanase precursor [Ruminiclostridium hungatei]|uniref:Endoglucanase n=1 Tax=Ruminiclostridium hungatei TaxID=48256 RepID=A0A1V4SK33_RUMHU|nr:S-layer homology domain-containing protein [Ruminiclostridium hungatei]OPX44230.1 endoglucanase precursor [Ruminiclostridium hungatei]